MQETGQNGCCNTGQAAESVADHLNKVSGAAVFSSNRTVRGALNAAIEEKQRELARLVQLRDRGSPDLMRMPLHELHEYMGAV